MLADIHILYQSDFYQVKDFRCHCTECVKSNPEYSDTFCVSFVRKGNFLFNVFRNSFDSYTGCVLVTKPGYERTVTHIHTVPDECTIFEFKPSFYSEILEYYGNLRFLFDNDMHASLVKINPETELLHHQIISEIINGSKKKLLIDNLVLDLIASTFNRTMDYIPDFDVFDNNKKNHLNTIEMAKDFITRNFHNDISLLEIAQHCHVSPFHFSRLFKKLTTWTPYQFLLQMRLKHAELLLNNTNSQVSEVAYSSGFNSIEHFTSVFSKKFNKPPTSFRNEKSNDFLRYRSSLAPKNI